MCYSWLLDGSEITLRTGSANHNYVNRPWTLSCVKKRFELRDLYITSQDITRPRLLNHWKVRIGIVPLELLPPHRFFTIPETFNRGKIRLYTVNVPFSGQRFSAWVYKFALPVTAHILSLFPYSLSLPCKENLLALRHFLSCFRSAYSRAAVFMNSDAAETAPKLIHF